MVEISNTDDIIDSRDIVERLAELDELLGRAGEIDDDAMDRAREREALRELAAKARDHSPDWEYGEALIRDSYFREYAMEMAEDIGAIDSGWPCNCIDWDKAVRELQMDYTCVSFDGVDYWIR